MKPEKSITEMTEEEFEKEFISSEPSLPDELLAEQIEKDYAAMSEKERVQKLSSLHDPRELQEPILSLLSFAGELDLLAFRSNLRSFISSWLSSLPQFAKTTERPILLIGPFFTKKQA